MFLRASTEIEYELMAHGSSDAVRLARRMEPLLSWKNNCRSPLSRNKAASDVSLRMYCAALVVLGLDVVTVFDGAVGRGAGGL